MTLLLAVLAIASLSGSEPPRARAHATAGPQIIDTAALCSSHALDANGDVVVPFGDPVCDDDGDGNPLEAGEFDPQADALPTIDLNGNGRFDPGETGLANADLDVDGVNESVILPVGTALNVVVHVHTGGANAANGTTVTGSVTGAARIIQWSLEAGGGLDANNNGVGDEAADGVLFDGADASTVVAESFGDSDGPDAAAGSCDDFLGDTCVDSAAIDAADGIVIFRLSSAVPQDVVLTVTYVGLTDTIRIIWTGAPGVPAAITVTSNETVIANSAQADGAGGVDEDATITITVLDSLGQPILGANIDCRLGPGNLADLLVAAADDGAAVAGLNLAVDDVSGPDGRATMSLEGITQPTDARGTVTVTCWADAFPEDDVQGEGEIAASVAVRVSGPPVAASLAGNATMPPGSNQTLTATVTDADGQPVADGTPCAWGLAGGSAGTAALVGGAAAATTGASSNASGRATNILLAGQAMGQLVVSVTCGGASATLVINVVAATPTPTPPPPTVSLLAGLNLVPALASGDLPAALTNCLALARSVFWWNAPAQSWAWHIIGAPPGVNTLDALRAGDIYWLFMAAACDWLP